MVYDGNDAVKWATHTSHSSPHGPYIAVMQDDRNIGTLPLPPIRRLI